MLKNQFLEEINSIHSTSKRPYADVTINDIKIKFLYDTGADVSCIQEETFRKLKLPITKISHKDCKSAGGQSLKILGQTELPLKFDGKTFSHTFLVIKDLNEKGIFGIDLISKHQLNYSPKNREFSWCEGNYWKHGVIKSLKQRYLAPLSVTPIKVQVETDQGHKVGEGIPIGICVFNPSRPLLTSMPGLITTDSNHSGTIMVQNCSPAEMMLQRGEIIGIAENYEEASATEISGEKINAVQENIKSKTIDKVKFAFLQENMNFKNIPEKYRREYEKVIMINHEIFSKNNGELGWSNLVEHEISLKNNAPVYVKQFKIPEMHLNEVEIHLQEWLKLGIIEPCRSRYNSPLFLVAKKDGGLRIVQDFRALNENSHVDKYSMHDVNECVAEIGRAGSTIFTTLDLTSGFWQMALHPRSRPYTAFTLPGKGQFQWKVAPMGLLGSPASFQRLVEEALKGINNVIVYIDDLLIHSHTHEEHVKLLDQVFSRLAKHGLKVNFKKCEFASQEVSYLGFRLTPDGIKPGTDKLKAVKLAQPPSTLKEIRQFMGLCNFFRNHVKNFSLISGPLTALTKKDSGWRKGILPEKALTAFKELQTILCSEPVVDYPRRDRAYALITDAACGDDKNPGGLGAILTQIDEEGQFRVIGYASRKLVKHEKNYTPFLLEMQAAIWGMEHFCTYLKGRHFTLYTDHKPLEKLGKVHTKTLNRLQEAMNIYDFKIVYKKGDEMPADFLSRNTVASISWNNEDIFSSQQKDELINDLFQFLTNGKVPHNTKRIGLIKRLSQTCFVEDNIVWKRLEDNSHRVVLFAPFNIKQDIMKYAHGNQYTGHEGIFKTKMRILTNYYWPNMDKDVIEFIESCHRCQMNKHRRFPIQALLKPLPQCSNINQRVHADLFGPLKTSGNNKKYILCMTDAFSKYVELVPLPDKEAATVAQAMFYKWLCRFGAPLIITTDGGKEFTAKVTKELYSVMKVEHFTTSPYHPQCNSQAEIVNKTIAKYLASFVDETTMDWELYLAPLMFAYNTSIHKATKFSPFKLTYGTDPRLPGFITPDVDRKFYGENTIDDLQNILKYTRQVAFSNNEENCMHYKEYFDGKVRQNSYQIGQKVLLNEFNFLHKNRKLAPKYTGPHEVTKVLHDTNVEVKLLNGRKTIVHVNRLKPYVTRNEDDVTDISPAFSAPSSDVTTNAPGELNSPPARADAARRPRGRPKKLFSPTSFENREGCPNSQIPLGTNDDMFLRNEDTNGRCKNNNNKNVFYSQNKNVFNDDVNLNDQNGDLNNSSTQNVQNEVKSGNDLQNSRITRSEAQRLSQQGQSIVYHKLNDIKGLKKGHKVSVSKKKSKSNYQNKNGSSTSRSLQEKYFQKTGDTWGPKSNIFENEFIYNNEGSDEDFEDALSEGDELEEEDEFDVGGHSEGGSQPGSNSNYDERTDDEFLEFDDNPFEGMAEGSGISDDEETDHDIGGGRDFAPKLPAKDHPPPVPPKLRSRFVGPPESGTDTEDDFSTPPQHLTHKRSEEKNKIHSRFYVRDGNEDPDRTITQLGEMLQANNDSSFRSKRTRMEEVLPISTDEEGEPGDDLESGATSNPKPMGPKSYKSLRPPDKRAKKRDVTTPASQRPTRSNFEAPPIGKLPIKPLEYQKTLGSSKKPS